MYCKNCDQSFSDEHIFCNNCGAKLENIDAAAEAQMETTTLDDAMADAVSEPQPVAEQEAKVETTPEPVLQPEAQPEPKVESKPEPQSELETKMESKPQYTIPQANATDSKNTAQSSQPVAFPAAEPNVDKKQSKTVSFFTWLCIILINIVPFTAGVIYTITAIIIPFFNLNDITIEGLILPALSLIYVVLLFVWAFGKPKARSLKNYSKATLIVGGIIVVFAFIAFLVLREAIFEFIELFQNMSRDFPF